MAENTPSEQAIRDQRKARFEKINAALTSGTLTPEDAIWAQNESVEGLGRSVANASVAFFLSNVPGIGPALATFVGEKILKNKFKIDLFPDVGWGKMTGGKVVRPAFFILGGAPFSYSIDALRQILGTDLPSAWRAVRIDLAIKKGEVKGYNKHKAEIDQAARAFGQTISRPGPAPAAALA